MLLVTGELQIEDGKFTPTFKMIPVSKECPYNEVIFDTDKKVLFIISKEKKENIHKVTYSKDIIIEKYYEYMLHIPTDIINFITLFSSNHEDFNYKSFMV